MPAHRLLFLAVLLSIMLSGCGVNPTTSDAPTSVPTPQAPTTVPTLPPATLTPTIMPTNAPTIVPTTAPTMAPAAATIGTPFQLKVGDTGAPATDLMITFRGVTNDSRCPSNVNCVWGGSVDMLLDVMVSGQSTTALTLRLYGNNNAQDDSAAQAGNYTIHAVAIAPYPLWNPPANTATPVSSVDTSIPGDDYVVTLLVEQAAQPTKTVAFERVQVGATEGFIVPAQAAQSFGDRGDTTWMPTANDVRAMETQLADYLVTAAAKRSPQLHEKQTTYKRQYAGLVRQNRKLIYTSFFCDADVSSQIDHQTLFVMDGGDCYFQTTYDVEQQAFIALQINGNA